MNPFSTLALEMGLTSESQGSNNTLAWLYLILSHNAVLFAASPSALTYSTNPAREVLHRLSAFQGTHAYQIMARTLSHYIDRYDGKGN